jgi:hypothetical protein
VDNELLEYVAVELMAERKEPDPRDRSTKHPDAEPAGEPFEEESVATIVPKLATQFA